MSEVMRRAAKSNPPRVLELGCAVGANVPLFEEIGADYRAIEGSDAAIGVLLERFPHLRDRIARADFTAGFPFEGPFDMIVDRSALTHNATGAIQRTLERVHEALRPGGWYLGIDWFSMRHTDAGMSHVDEDQWTRTGYTSGRFAGIGRVHFADEAHLRDLFAAFEIEVLDEKVVEQRAKDHACVATWNVVARKP